MARKVLVLDANILIRAVLGRRIRRILEAHVDDVSLFVPETAYAEAEEHLAALVITRAAIRCRGRFATLWRLRGRRPPEARRARPR